MPQVSIGTIDKRINSTKNTFSSSFSADCKLKEPCSMHNPVFLVQGLSKSNFYNYAQFEGRYYWIDDIVYRTRDIQEVTCHLDPLATYKNAIKATQAWVVFGDSGHWNKKIDDLRMQPEIQSTSAVATIESLFTTPLSPDNGTVLMRVMQCGVGGDQGVKTFAMSFATFGRCLEDLTGFFDGLTEGVTESIVDLIQTFAKLWASLGGQGSWRDNILAVTYMPIPISYYASIGEHDELITIGGVPCGANQDFYAIKPLHIVKNKGSLTIPWTADQEQYEFLKNPRWTAFQVQTPGSFQAIDPTDLKDQKSFGFFSALDVCSGEWSCKITEGFIDTGEIVASSSGQMGIDILGLVGSAASFTSPLSKAFNSIVSGSIASFGSSSVSVPIGESKTVTGATITQTKTAEGNMKATYTAGMATSTPIYRTESSGIGGGFLSSGFSVGTASGAVGGGATPFFLYDGTNPGSIVVKGIGYKPADLAHYTDYCDKYGYPCNAFLTLGDISGYCQCVGASVDTAAGATTEDKATINSFLNGGLYIE